jgi:hypothetical protein
LGYKTVEAGTRKGKEKNMKNMRIIYTILAFTFFVPLAYAQSGFIILPDYHLTPQWVKAGAYFKYNGKRVKVSHVNIHVLLPVSRDGNNYIYKTRRHNENNVGEPDWSGWWHEPWKMGFFYYTVTATYNGRVYKKVFVVGRNRWFEALNNVEDIARKIAAVVAAGRR